MRTVTAVERRTFGSGQTEIPGWAVIYSDPANTTGLTAHLFPDETLYWRSAEYGIHPDEAEILLHAVLHEQLDPIQPDHPHFLYNTDQDAARTAYLDRVAQTARTRGMQDPQGLLTRIHQHHRRTMDWEQHRMREGVVHAMRQRAREDRH